MAGVFEDEDAGDPKAFAAWVTELCGLVASSKGTPDGARTVAEAAFELLQNLAAAIGRAERPVVREHQRRVEDAPHRHPAVRNHPAGAVLPSLFALCLPALHGVFTWHTLAPRHAEMPKQLQLCCYYAVH